MMTAAEKLNTSKTNGTASTLDTPDSSPILRPGMNRRVIFMRKLEVAEGAQSEYCFEPPHDGEDMVQHTVALKRIILGMDADPQELCAIELETKVDNGKVEKFPLAYLRQDMLQVPIELFLSEASKIRIVKGKGPVFIVGEYAEEWRDDEPEEADESGNEVDEEDLVSEEDEVAEGNNKENGVLSAVRKRKMNKNDETATVKKLRQEDAAPVAMDAENGETNENGNKA